MAEKVSTIDVRQRIGDLLNRVALRHDEFIIERKGKPLAASCPSSVSSRCAGSRGAMRSTFSIGRRAAR